MIKLNLGCGWRNFGSDWIHIDGGDYGHLDYNDITNLEFEDNSVDLIYASHVIEYFDINEVKQLLREWRRVLKPGGELRVAVPDFEAMNILYHNGKVKLKDIIGPLYGRMPMGDKMIYHKTTYDFSSIKRVLEEAGFKNVVHWDWENTEHSDFDPKYLGLICAKEV